VNRRLLHILLLIAFGLILTATAKYLPVPVVLGTLSIFILVSLTLSFISIRKKTAAGGPISGLQKVSGAVIYSSAFGAIIALALIVFHVRYIGRPLLNFSLVLFIVGALVGIIAPAETSNISPDVKRQTFVFRGVIYSSIICSVIGILLRINHYPGGKLLMFGGLLFVVLFLIFLIVYKKYVDSYSK
jgi:hypothetical protein